MESWTAVPTNISLEACSSSAWPISSEPPVCTIGVLMLAVEACLHVSNCLELYQ